MARKRAGFTLLELSVSTAIFAFFLTLVVIGTVNVVQIFQKANTMRSNQQAARGVIEEIRREASFAERVSLVKIQDDGSAGPLKQPNKTQGATYGICIERSAGTPVMYYIDYAYGPAPAYNRDYPGGGHPHQDTIIKEQVIALDPSLTASADPIGDAKLRNIISSSVSNGSQYYFSTKRVYKSLTCDTTSPDFAGTSQPVLGGNNSSFDNVNVQFMRLTAITTGPYGTSQYTTDRIPSTSIKLDIMTTQKGAPGRATSSSGNPGKEYDDTLLLTTIISPSTSQY